MTSHLAGNHGSDIGGAMKPYDPQISSWDSYHVEEKQLGEALSNVPFMSRPAPKRVLFRKGFYVFAPCADDGYHIEFLIRDPDLYFSPLPDPSLHYLRVRLKATDALRFGGALLRMASDQAPYEPIFLEETAYSSFFCISSSDGHVRIRSRAIDFLIYEGTARRLGTAIYVQAADVAHLFPDFADYHERGSPLRR